MKVFEVILIGITLAIDACAVTVANCATYKKTLSRKQEWFMPICFSIFQFLMPVIGYYLGSIFADKIGPISKFISAGIFLVLSLKIFIEKIKEIIEFRKEKEVEICSISTTTPEKPFTFSTLIIQGVATSIDALAIGVVLAIELSFSIFIAGAIIGVTTFILVALSLFLGKFLSKAFNEYAEWVGAIILFLLFIKSLVEAF